jgi:hypothetical protein
MPIDAHRGGGASGPFPAQDVVVTAKYGHFGPFSSVTYAVQNRLSGSPDYFWRPYSRCNRRYSEVPQCHAIARQPRFLRTILCHVRVQKVNGNA